MELILTREYQPGGTNGLLTLKGDQGPFCYTIELPWNNNQPKHSCIPEGSYLVTKRTSEKLGDHLLVNSVPGRDLILIHPANDAVVELEGCIAPVTTLIAPGKGLLSVKANQKLLALVDQAISNNETILLTITH